MTWLAFRRSERQQIDQRCGDLSYPLYVHHENMLILALSMTAGYTSWPLRYPTVCYAWSILALTGYAMRSEATGLSGCWD
jgi:peptidoglycan/LPS O-acetylase OafA/YrhL